MGEPATPYITIEITLGKKQNGKRKATKGTLKVYLGTYQDYKHGQKGKEVLSVPIVSGGIDDNNNVYEPASKGIYKNRKFTTAKKGSGNDDLSNDAHGGPDNIIIRLYEVFLIHQGYYKANQEIAYTQGCIAITAYELHEDNDGKTDVDRNYQAFSEIIKSGGTIDVIIK